MENKIEQFEAVTENGDKFTINCFERIVTTNSLSRFAQKIPGAIRYETTCGLAVNTCKDPNQFEIVQTDQIVRRI